MGPSFESALRGVTRVRGGEGGVDQRQPGVSPLKRARVSPSGSPLSLSHTHTLRTAAVDDTAVSSSSSSRFTRRARVACPQPQYRFTFRYRLVSRSFPVRFGRSRVFSKYLDGARRVILFSKKIRELSPKRARSRRRDGTDNLSTVDS